MFSLPQVTQAIQRVLTELPTRYARSSGFTQRRSKLTAALFVQTVVLGWLAHPTASLQQLCQIAADRGVRLSPQGLFQRLSPAAARLLEQVLTATMQTVITTEPQTAGVLARFPAVLIVDSTTVRLPDALAPVWAGCGGRVPTRTQAALKLSVRLDLVRGTLEGPLLSAGRMQDKRSPLHQAPSPVGALRLADLGYWSLRSLQAIAETGAYFLSRLDLHTTVWQDGVRLELPRWLSRQGPIIDTPVTLGQRTPVPVRLLGVRVPGPVAAERRRRLRAMAKREGRTPGRQQLALADWTLLVTNVELARLSVAEALVLARARWQVELLFKLWKHDAHLTQWRSTAPLPILCEVYAKLLALVLQHWLLLSGGWHWTVHSLSQGAQAVRDHVPGLALTLDGRCRLGQTLQAIGRRLASGCTIAPRRTKPSTLLLLTDPSLGGLA